MNTSSRILGVIPARGGSKGVLQKNIRPLNGKPLISYTIELSLHLSELNECVVSTDDEIIKQVAEESKIRVIDRPRELAADTASTESVLLHVLDVYSNKYQENFDYIVVLEPTSPLRTLSTVRDCIENTVSNNRVSLMTVREIRENVGQIQEGNFHPICVDAPRRRQDRTPLYTECGVVYICKVSHLRTTGSLLTNKTTAYVVNETESIDINTEEDFRLAEYLVRLQKKDDT